MILLESIVKHTQSISSFDYIIISYGATLDFSDVNEMEFCVGAFNSSIASSVHCLLLFKRYIERIVLTRENRKHE